MTRASAGPRASRAGIGPRRGLAAALAAVWLLAACGAALAFDLQGHRGARGLAPENTLAAFATALELGVDTLELDVGVTRDDVLVVAHDRVLNPELVRGPDGAWLAARGPALRTLTLAELRAYDVGRLRPGSGYAATFAAQRPADGERIPTLGQVFELAARHGADTVRFNIETKLSPLAPGETADVETFARLLVDAIRAAKVAPRASVQSFDWRTLARVRELAPEIATVHLTSRQGAGDTIRADDPNGSPWTAGVRHADHGSVARMVVAAGGTTWSPNALDVDAAAIAAARALGLRVVPWTVNDPAAMARLIDWGVDGLITDRPDLLRDVLAARGMTLPRRWPRRP